LAEIDLEQAAEVLPRLNRDLQGLKILTRPLAPLLKLASRLPEIGPTIGQLDPLLLYAANLTQAGHLTIQTFEPLLAGFQAETSTEEFSSHLYALMSSAQPSLMKAAQAVDRAGLVRQQIDSSYLPPEVWRMYSRLDGRFPDIQQGFHLLAAVPVLFGTPDSPRTYLLLAQNRDELRAGGGFISAIGSLQLAAGQIVTMEIADSYQVDDYSKGYPPPPEPLRRFMTSGYWVPRDANWSPDFPTSAQKAQELHTLSTGQTTDGVIAFDQAAARTLVQILGPLELPDFPETITADNIEMAMQYAWEPQDGTLSQEWWQHRKDFIPQMATALMERLLGTQDRAVMVRLAQEMVGAVKAGHILVYFNQPEVQTALEQAGLGNRVIPGEGDFLLLVDSNLGFNKTDAVVARSATYFVDLADPQEPAAMLILKYHHTVTQEVACVHETSYGSGVYQDMQQRCYWDYWRLYTRADTRLTEANRTPVPGEWLLDGTPWDGEVTTQPGEQGTQEIAGFFVLPTSQQQDLSLQFDLPGEILKKGKNNAWVYKLRIQKQAGLADLPLVLQIRAPAGTQWATPESGWQLDSASGFWIWSGKIEFPSEFELVFSPINPAP